MRLAHRFAEMKLSLFINSKPLRSEQTSSEAIQSRPRPSKVTRRCSKAVQSCPKPFKANRTKPLALANKSYFRDFIWNWSASPRAVRCWARSRSRGCASRCGTAPWHWRSVARRAIAVSRGCHGRGGGEGGSAFRVFSSRPPSGGARGRPLCCYDCCVCFSQRFCARFGRRSCLMHR